MNPGVKKEVPRTFEVWIQEILDACKALVAHGGVYFVPAFADAAFESCKGQEERS
jgi:hypothetical protein